MASGLVVLISVIALFMIVSKVINKSALREKRYINGKRVYWIVGGYVAVLLIAMGVFFIVPMASKSIPSGTVDRENTPNLYIFEQTGKSIDTLSDFMVDQQAFTHQHDELQINWQIAGDSYFHYPVLIERTNDDQVEVMIYQTPIIIDGMDITKYVDQVEVKRSSDTLKIIPKKVDLSIASFQTGFPFRQFDKDREPWFEEDDQLGAQLLYFRIPDDIQLHVEEEIEVEYVGE